MPPPKKFVFAIFFFLFNIFLHEKTLKMLLEESGKIKDKSQNVTRLKLRKIQILGE